MKITKAKTRRGVLAWLAKRNLWITAGVRKDIYHDERIVAVHVFRSTGEVESWECADGTRIAARSGVAA